MSLISAPAESVVGVSEGAMVLYVLIRTEVRACCRIVCEAAGEAAAGAIGLAMVCGRGRLVRSVG